MITSHNSNNQVTNNNHEQPSSIFKKLKNIISISEILRIFGACAVIASMSLFLLNGWSEGNDIQRYLKLLAQTGLLTVAGITLSFILKENKGARLFFGLSLISVVANFTILGALTYSIFPFDNGLVSYPEMVTWKAVELSTFMPIFIGAITLLSVLTWFSFSIFARKISAPLTITFLSMCALLLIPFRSSLTVSIVAFIALWLSSVFVKKINQTENIVFTNETKFALGLVFAPGLLIIARALSLYHVDQIMLLTLSGLAYISLRSWLTRFDKKSLLKSTIEILNVATSIFIAFQVTELFPHSLEILHATIFSIIAASLNLDQIKRSSDPVWQKTILNLTIAGLVILNICVTFFSNDMLQQILVLLTCSGLFTFIQQLTLTLEQKKFSKLMTITGMIASTLMLSTHLVSIMNLSNWVVIGLIGAALIIGGSLYERYGLSLSSVKN